MMGDESKVWISSRRLASGKRAYYLRWINHESGGWKNKKVGTDKKRAEGERVTMEKRLREGTYTEVRKTDWQAFVDDHVGRIKGDSDAREARRALAEFGKVGSPRQPTDVSYRMIESYVAHLEKKGNRLATINKKLRYLRAAFNKAVKRAFMVQNPMSKWEWVRENEPAVRIVTPEEETALLDKAEKLYGFRWRALLYVALNTGARRGELLTLTWDRVDFGGERIHLTNTKGKKDRLIPVAGEVLALLRRLQVQTLKDGGPFVGMDRNMQRLWDKLVATAEVEGVTLHDLRRSYVTRLIRAGVPLPTVQKLAGHSSINTTLRYYNWVSDKDMREGVAKLQAVAG